MRQVAALLFGLALSGCGSTWETIDEDGDGYSIVQGDCNDGPGGEGIGPGATEVWYNGIDENCDGNDGDQDGDGHLSVLVGGDDCWDDPNTIPEEFRALNGFAQPTAADVHPGASDPFYDGIDQDCAGDDDFDQDGDGFASMAWPETRTSLPITDCYDAETEPYPENWPECIPEGERVVVSPLSPSQINPDAVDQAYDGTDANCDGLSDFDVDGDGYNACEECNDEDPTIFPNDSEEIWYNGIDENCDGNDGDKDGDGYVVAGYEEPNPPIHFGLGTDDCWDDPDARPDEMEAINGFDDPAAEDVHPDAAEVWYDGVDGNCDGGDDFDQDGDAHATDSYADRSGSVGDDCDDLDGTIYSGAPDEWYDGIDSDCAGNSDFDQDGDGHDAEGYGVGGDDCDDSRAGVNPDVNEDCATTYDDDCDGNTNDDDAEDCSEFFLDADGDSYGNLYDSRCLCEEEGDYYVTGVTVTNQDCDDDNEDAHPGATEVVNNGVDENCDGVETCYTDSDGDGYGTKAQVDSDDLECTGAGLSENDDDCDDSNADTFPGAAEEDSTTACMNDDDGDGYGDDSPKSGVTAGTDCDDSDADTFPGAAEKDSTTACMTDSDGDGYGDDSPGSGVTAGSDCDDARSAVKPGATETCSTTYDDDCDGSTNDIGATGCTTYYYDGDGDGYGSTTSQCTCTTSGSYDVTNDDDCDDGDADTFPGAAEKDSTTACMTDADRDGYGDDSPATGVTAGSDCDDARFAVKPGATETCSTSYDDDCDGSTNDVGATGCTTYYYDGDGDGYGTTTSQCTCTASGSYDVTNDDDCDDSRSGVHPGATETCSTTYDDDCDGSTNDVGATGCTTYYYDGDGDGYGTTTSQCTCSASGDYDVTNDDDCDDSRSGVYPGATEKCSTTYDDDCDGDTNDVGATGCTTYYYDGDGDGYGTTTSQCTCSASGSYDVTNDDDCDDSKAGVNPAATETCSTTYDDDCDGSSNDVGATGCTTYYYDGDGDGYGLSTSSQCTCSASGDYDVTNSTDCDDSRSGVHPGATESCSTTYDDDCDGSTNDVGATGCTTYYYDGDNDGYGLSTSSQCTCTASGSYDVTNSTDCKDSDANTFPGAAEAESSSACMTDADGDGFGDDGPSSGVTAGTDCDDSKAAVNPDELELCSTSYDDDCDGSANEIGASDCVTYYDDFDGDGYGDATDTLCACSAVGTHDVTNDDDCDDADDNTFPGAAAFDSSSQCMTDGDGDGYGDDSPATGVAAGTDCDDADATINPGEDDLLTVGDLVDNDCDGYIDNGGIAEGDILITEFQAGTTAGAASLDWFELYNNSGYTVVLEDWEITLCHNASGGTSSPPYTGSTGCTDVTLTLTDGSGSPLTLDDAQYLVICASYGEFTGSTSVCDLRLTDFDSPAYTASTDLEPEIGGIEVLLPDATSTITDSVYWWTDTSGNNDWPTSSAGSIQLNSDVIAGATGWTTYGPDEYNDNFTSTPSGSYNNYDIWCVSDMADGASDYSASGTIYGTPGAANHTCP